MFCNAVISSFFQGLKILASLKKGFCLHENKQAKISQFFDYAIANILPHPQKDINSVSETDIIQVTLLIIVFGIVFCCTCSCHGM